MNREQTLEAAKACVLRGRDDVYGTPEDSFGLIADLWNAYLGIDAVVLEAHDVAAMMALLKIARIRSNPGHSDSWADLAGYAACGAECSSRTRQPKESDAYEGWACK